MGYYVNIVTYNKHHMDKPPKTICSFYQENAADNTIAKYIYEYMRDKGPTLDKSVILQFMTVVDNALHYGNSLFTSASKYDLKFLSHTLHSTFDNYKWDRYIVCVEYTNC